MCISVGCYVHYIWSVTLVISAESSHSCSNSSCSDAASYANLWAYRFNKRFESSLNALPVIVVLKRLRLTSMSEIWCERSSATANICPDVVRYEPSDVKLQCHLPTPFLILNILSKLGRFSNPLINFTGHQPAQKVT